MSSRAPNPSQILCRRLIMFGPVSFHPTAQGTGIDAENRRRAPQGAGGGDNLKDMAFFYGFQGDEVADGGEAATVVVAVVAALTVASGLVAVTSRRTSSPSSARPSV